MNHLHSYEDWAHAQTDRDTFQPGDIVLLPNDGYLAIRADYDGEHLMCPITPGSLFGDDEDQRKNFLALSQPDYADNLKIAWALINQNTDTPYYHPRYRVLDQYIPNLTRDRGLYEHIHLDGRTVVRYPDPDPDNRLVGWVLSFTRRDTHVSIPVHHSGRSLGAHDNFDEATDHLIRLDLATTRDTNIGK